MERSKLVVCLVCASNLDVPISLRDNTPIDLTKDIERGIEDLVKSLEVFESPSGQRAVLSHELTACAASWRGRGPS